MPTIASMDEPTRRRAGGPTPGITLLRRVAAVLAGAYVASWIPALAIKFLDLGPTVGWPLLVAGAVLGGYGGYREGLRLVPLDSQEHGDAVIGWSLVLAAIGVIVSFLLPAPWHFAAAVAWVLLVVFVGRTLMASGP